MSGQRMSGDPGQVARSLIEAAFGGDFETARSYCAPDLVLRIEGTLVVRGHEGLRQLMEFNAEVASEARVEIHHVIGAEDKAAVNRTTFLTIGGNEVQLEVGSFFTLRGGLVVEWVDYQDMRIVTTALGH